MNKIDIRFSQTIMENLQHFIGTTFQKYCQRPFVFTNSVTQKLELHIDNSIYELNNYTEPLDYYGALDDVAVLHLEEKEHECLIDPTLIDISVNEIIKEIHVIQENQRLFKNGKQIYDVWLTRGIIFVFDTYEISFEKDIWFSEEIYINRGYDLINTFANVNRFCTDWDSEYRPECSREIIIIK